MLLPDYELWQKVDRLWVQNGLKEDEGMKLEKATPIILEIIRKS